MEFELGLNLTRIADEFSSADFLFSKDRAGPVFISTETDTMFILTAHLKGYRKRNIKIEINENGTRIVVSGEKAIQETVMVEWNLYQKGTEMRRFRKAFKIPDGVILDKIKDKYNEDESILTISMPKKEKGIRGFNIEEVKEQELAIEGSETLHIVPDEVPEQENGLQENHEETEAEYAEETGLEEAKSSKMHEIANVEEPKTAGLNVANPEETQVAEVHDTKEEEMEENQLDQNKRLQKPLEDHRETIEGKIFPDEVTGEGSAKSPVVESHITTDETSQGESVVEAKELEKKEISQGVKRNRGRCKMCPILGGSALLLSLVVFVIQVIRTKNQQGKRKY